MALEIRTKEKMMEVLANPSVSGPENAYYMLRGNPNITIWENGKYGNEFIKTYGHYHIHGESETYKVLFGEGISIVQHRTKEDSVDRVDLRKVKAGDIVQVPSGTWGHAFANTGSTYLITSDDAPNDASHAQNDYLPIKEKHGMAYYILEKEGKVIIEKNPNYQNLPQAEWVEG